jgi:hypothetical protein
MNKYIKNSIIGATTLSMILIGCSKEDNNTGKSNITVAQDVNGVISLVSPLVASQTVNEVDEGIYEFKITLNKAQSVPIVVGVKQVSGSANEDDFSFDSIVTIPAYSLVGTGNITIKNNDEAESDETFKLQIGDIATSNASIPTSELNFTIKNFASSDLSLTLNYDKEFTISGRKYNLYTMGYDIDFEVRNAAGVDTGNTAAQTAATPEKLTITPTTFPNGIYTVKFVVYETGHVTGTTNTPTSGLDTNFHDPFIIPINVDYLKLGVQKGNINSIVQPSSLSVPTTTGNVIRFEVSAGNVKVL